MSRRIEIELTSARPDGTWTWRAAGAREPKGVLAGDVLPAGCSVGDVFRAEAEVELDGLTIVSVLPSKEKASKSGLLELLPSARPFEAVTQQLAPRRERSPRREGDRPRSDRPRRDGDARREGPPRREGDPRRPGGPGGDRRRDNGGERHRRPEGERPPRRESRPQFTAPPELPQRPKPKRLKPGRAHRTAVVAGLPEEQRPVAERVLQGGIPAVRQAVQEQNARLRAEGQPEVGSGLVQMAEQLLPTLRVAEWLDRAEAAKRDVDELDLRDLRSVVAAAEDPLVVRDETTRELAAELKQALHDKQEREHQAWLEDIDAALGVGRVIRALKLSGQPPKAGVPFPAELSNRLVEASVAALEPTATSERWSALLEAIAFSPIRTHVLPAAKPEQVSDDLVATLKRIGSLLPQIAELFGVEPKTGGLPPRPLRPTRPEGGRKQDGPRKETQGKPKESARKPKDVEAKTKPAAPEPEVVAEKTTTAVPEPEVVAEETATAVPEPDVVAEETTTAAPEPEVVAEETTTAVPEPEVVAEETTTAVLEPEVVAEETTTAVPEPEVVAEETTTAVPEPEVVAEETTTANEEPEAAPE